MAWCGLWEYRDHLQEIVNRAPDAALSEYNDQLFGERMAFLDFYLHLIIPATDNSEL